MNSIWSSSPGFIARTPILKKSTEMLGVVMSAGVNDKTVKVGKGLLQVKVKWQVWNKKYGIYYKRTKNYHVHDEEMFARPGDIVVIKSCQKVSNTKAYFVRNIVRQTGRYDYWQELIDRKEEEVKRSIGQAIETLKTEKSSVFDKPKSSIERAEIIREYKLKAMAEAIQRIKIRDKKKFESLGEEKSQN